MPTLHGVCRPGLHYLGRRLHRVQGEPETILLLHGNAESSLAWYAWIPTLARRYRVLRPDMRASTERRVHNALR